MENTPPVPVLELSTVGFAVLTGGRTAWWNPAFEGVAARSGATPAALAERLARTRGRALEPLADGDHAAVHVVEVGDSCLVEVTQTPRTAALPPLEHARDAVTGALSRAGIEAEIDRWFARAAAAPFALAFLDLDNFKTVNDLHGHATGDRCLREVGRRLLAAVRAVDVVGRYGGDEFVLLLDRVATPEALAPIAERVIDAIGEPIAVGGLSLEVGASLGAAYSGPALASPAAMLEAADRAMYAHKRAAARRGGDVAGTARLG